MSLFGGDSGPPSANADAERDSPEAENLYEDQQSTALGASESDAPFGSDLLRSEQTDSEEDSRGESDEEDDRENIFHGHSSTWRNHAREQIALLDSLNKETANDLSRHLYNAHALKARLRQPNPPQAPEPWQSKDKWIPAEEDGQRPWHPNQAWTAWPLKPGDVPRSDESFSAQPCDEEDTFQRQKRWKPSGDLEEEVLAFMLRQAKEQWEARPRSEESTMQSAISEEEELKRGSRRMGLPGRERNRASSKSADLSAEEDDDPEQEPEAADGSSSDEDYDGGDLHPKAKQPLPGPVFLADDDEASRILQPTVRHTLSMLDDLLMGLHKSRANHCGVTDQEIEKNMNSSSPGTKIGTSPKPVKRRKLHRTGTGVKLNTRDWSEVLGTASMVGWDQAVVARATTRCASLFGEGMLFRTVPEGPSEMTLSTYMPEMAPPLDTPSEASSASFSEQIEEPMSLYCPHADCPRHADPFRMPFRLREHLKRSHKYTAEEIQELEAGLNRSAPTSWTRTQRDWTPPDPLVCPLGGCKEPDKVYKSRKLLIQHLQRLHGWDPLKQSSPPEDDDASSENSSEDHDELGDDDMVGGVHNDGFLKSLSAPLQRPRVVKNPKPWTEGRRTAFEAGDYRPGRPRTSRRQRVYENKRKVLEG